MKSFLLIFFTSSFFLASPSKTSNFFLENNRLHWQKIYASQLNQSELLSAIRNSGNFTNTSVFGNKIFAEISEVPLNFTANELSIGQIPSLFISHHLKSYVVFEFKNGKYRVTCKSIKFIPRFYTSDTSHRIMEVEEVALKNQRREFRDRFIRKHAIIMNETLSSIADFSEWQADDNW